MDIEKRRAAFDAYLKKHGPIKLNNGLYFKTTCFSTCPCCGYPTLPQEDPRFCYACNWVYPETDDIEIATLDNDGLTLTQVRKNFSEYRNSRGQPPSYQAVLEEIQDLFNQLLEKQGDPELLKKLGAAFRRESDLIESENEKRRRAIQNRRI